MQMSGTFSLATIKTAAEKDGQPEVAPSGEKGKTKCNDSSRRILVAVWRTQVTVELKISVLAPPRCPQLNQNRPVRIQPWQYYVQEID